MRGLSRSVVWVTAAIAIAVAVAAILILRPSPPINVSAVSSYNSGGLVAGPVVIASGMGLGAADPDRDIWLEISWQFFGQTRMLDSVTVGGIPAKRLVRNNDVPTSVNSEIWMLHAGTGGPLGNAASADVVYHFDGGNPSITTQIYRVVGASQTPSATAVGSGTVSITIPPDGAALISLINSGTSPGALSNVAQDFRTLCGKDFLAIHASTGSASGGPLTATFPGGPAAAIAAVALGPTASRK